MTNQRATRLGMDQQRISAWFAENCAHCRKSWPTSDRTVCPIEESLLLAFFGDTLDAAILQRMNYQDDVQVWRCPEFVRAGSVAQHAAQA